jgi:hypothetical protein
VLIPFALLQIFLNGLVIVYDLPNVALLATSGLGAVSLMCLAFRVVRRGEARMPLQMVPVRATAVPARSAT